MPSSIYQEEKTQFTNEKSRDLLGMKSSLIGHIEMISSNVHKQIFAGIISSDLTRQELRMLQPGVCRCADIICQVCVR